MHKNDIKPNQKVLIVDDLIATGGTIVAINDLLKKVGAKVCSALFVVELPKLNGKQILLKNNINIESLIQYEDVV
jgi:adenine phosphoribosyltransferase